MVFRVSPHILTAKFLKNKPISVIQVTNIHRWNQIFTIFCSWLILKRINTNRICSPRCSKLKGVIDAVDGELSRIRSKPSFMLEDIGIL